MPPAVAVQTPTVIAAAGSAGHVLLLLSDGSVVALGQNSSGELGRPATASSSIVLPAARVELPRPAVEVAAGSGVSYARLDDGTVWAWGAGARGELGVHVVQRHAPMPVPGLQSVVQLSAWSATATAVLADGTVRQWGQVARALRPGDWQVVNVFEPQPIVGVDGAVQASSGPEWGYALRADGRMLVWGRNDHGQLGLGKTTPETERVAPTLIPTVSEVVSMTMIAATHAAAAVTRDGRVWTWGHNGQAGLGHGPRADTSDPSEPTPRPVNGIADAVTVKSSGGRHVIVRRRDGSLTGWGNSDWGQLGTAFTSGFQPTPVAITLPGVDDYWPAGIFTLARTKDGVLWFWGEHSLGALLVDAPRNQSVPARVAPGRYLPAAP